MRKLASIQIIKGLTPIKGADKIELAHILGWQCVVGKGQFRKDDKCVYFEVDSFLPIKPEFEFLRSRSYKVNPLLGEGFRLKTMNFKGEISQGLAMPLSSLSLSDDLAEGTDVTEELGVREWTMPETVGSQGIMIGDRPSFIPKTDETRIQSIPALFEEFKGIPYYITTKCDGSSHSIGIDENGKFHMTGHNYEFKDEPGTSGFVDLVRKKDYERLLRKYMIENNLRSMVVQGELCGEGIQKNRLRLKSPDWFVFTVIEDGKRVGMKETSKAASAIGASLVPFVYAGSDLTKEFPAIELLLDYADGLYPNGGTREGIVIRPQEPVYSETLHGPLSIKVINNKYLLKE